MFEVEKFESTTVDNTVSVKYTDQEVFSRGNEKVSPEDIKNVAEYSAAYVNTAVDAANEQAKTLLEKDKKIEKVIVNFPFSASKKGSVDVTFDRSREIRNPGNGEIKSVSTIRVNVSDHSVKPAKRKIEVLQKELTKLLLG